MDGNIDNIIDKKIDDIVKKNNIYHIGKVVKINNYIIEATGLEDVFFFEKVYIKNESNIGYVDKIEEDKVVIALIKTNGDIRINDSITASGEVLQSSYSKNSMGMIIDPFGNDKMSGKKFNDCKQIPIESPYIPIMKRTPVNRPLETGIAAIDLMFPIGKGQRQLIIGDKKTGKTQILLDTIANQKNKNVICIYVAIGKTKKEVKRVFTKLTEKQTNSYTLIVAAFNDDPVPLIKLTPYVALSIAQEYMLEGFDVLVCIDDLKTHADACREMALIAEKNTGRDAYPADIFYIHSRLLEKGCQYENGASITILPTVQTKSGDITDYISTNIISITDGQIVLSEKLFKKGQKPAINFGLSVSRLGGAVQSPDIKKIGAVVRREVLSYLETSDVYQLVNVESLSDELQSKIFKGQKLLGLLNQRKFSPMSQEKLIADFGYVAGLGDSKVVDELIKDIELTKRIESDEKPEKIKEIKVSTEVDESLVEHAPKKEAPKEDYTKKDYFARPSNFGEKNYSSTDMANSGITYVNMDEQQKNEEFSYVVKQDSTILNPESQVNTQAQETIQITPEQSTVQTEISSSIDNTNNQNIQQ
jgi:F-type H+/Na+-transporting ATPase subunit alpha